MRSINKRFRSHIVFIYLNALITGELVQQFYSYIANSSNQQKGRTALTTKWWNTSMFRNKNIKPCRLDTLTHIHLIVRASCVRQASGEAVTIGLTAVSSGEWSPAKGQRSLDTWRETSHTQQVNLCFLPIDLPIRRISIDLARAPPEISSVCVNRAVMRRNQRQEESNFKPDRIFPVRDYYRGKWVGVLFQTSPVSFFRAGKKDCGWGDASLVGGKDLCCKLTELFASRWLPLDWRNTCGTNK